MDKMHPPTQLNATRPDAAPSHAQTMQRIWAGIKKTGDMPIFSTSINRVRRASSNPDSDAMEVAHEVMNDANLTAKLLRLSNSAYYNRGYGKVAVISRAVVLLGFETVVNLTLTMKLIESFQQEHPTIDMNKMLVKSFLAAGFARDVAQKCGVKDIESTYVCALLHNLGEIIVASILSAEFNEILRLRSGETPLKKQAAEMRVLGTTTSLIGQEVATRWEFAPSVSSSMSDAPLEIKGTLRNSAQLNRALSALSNKVVGSLYVPQHEADMDLTSVMHEMAVAGGLDISGIENCLGSSFERSCELADDYGLNKKILRPVMDETEDPVRDRWARRFSYVATTGKNAAPQEQETAELDKFTNKDTLPSSSVASVKTVKPGTITTDEKVINSSKPGKDSPVQQTSGVATKPDNNVQVIAMTTVDTSDLIKPESDNNLATQLEYIREITAMMSAKARLNEVFFKVAEGIHRGARFDRALMCLLGSTRSSYAGRLAIGTNSDKLKEYFSFPLNPEKDIFSKVMVEGKDLIVENVDDGDWHKHLATDFSSVIGAIAFVVAPLRYDNRPLGFFYADKAVTGKPITKDDFQNFLQFVEQARLALHICK